MNKKITATIIVVILAVIGVFIYAANQGLIGDSERNVDENSLELLDPEEPELATNIETMINQSTTFGLGESNFEKLTNGHYEGWVISGDNKIPFGKFNIDDNGNFVDLGGVRISDNELSVDLNDQSIDKIAITIEPDGDTDTIPSPVVAAVIDGGAGGRLAFNAVDIPASSGQYILGTPSDDPAGNENSGLWFAIPGNPPSPSLNLPAVPAGWVYEGWAVYEGNALTTGRFTDANSGDNFSDYNASDRIPNLPGEDFLQNLPNGLVPPIDLANGTSKAVVTLEPDINGVDPTGPGPFQVKFLVADIPAGLVDHSVADLTLDTSSVPFIDISVK